MNTLPCLHSCLSVKCVPRYRTNTLHTGKYLLLSVVGFKRVANYSPDLELILSKSVGSTVTITKFSFVT